MGMDRWIGVLAAAAMLSTGCLYGGAPEELGEAVQPLVQCSCAASPGPSGDRCCASARFCSQDGVCTRDRGLGAACNRNTQCASGSCLNGLCVDISSVEPPGVPSEGGGGGCFDDDCLVCYDGENCLIRANPN